MWLIIVFLTLGVVLGVKCEITEKQLKLNDKISLILVVILLFAMGAQVGQDKEILSKIPVLGVQALMLAIGAVAGSVVLVRLTIGKFHKECDSQE